MQNDDRGRLPLGGRQGRLPGRSKLLITLMLAGVLALALFAWALLLNGPARRGLAPKDVSSTAEAVQFATSQTIRQTTRVAEAGTGTRIARATGTAEMRSEQIAARETSGVMTVQAHATAEAPATQTIQARQFEAARTVAEATVQALMQRATPVYGPASGTLKQQEGNQVACDASQVTLQDFVAEVKFHNPNSPSRQTWDYGLIFTNLEDSTDYRLSLNSAGKWTLNLHGDSYDIETATKAAYWTSQATDPMPSSSS